MTNGRTNTQIIKNTAIPPGYGLLLCIAGKQTNKSQHDL